MSNKTQVHVAVFLAALVDVEVDGTGELMVQAECLSISEPRCSSAMWPNLNAQVDGEDKSDLLRAHVTRICGHLVIKEAEKIIRGHLEEGSRMQAPAEKDPEAKA